ncbi:phytoene desaturase [Alphaproteobacteria bacterium GH1-50]|uniref:Phytoene dehydrogenase n=1 Tax=Kangsaoukella pontilimi TaxID=2691042 RepID=A0A7C9MIH6_9RHOB|nr:phytoene desaturase [Kangsaoukella pontilimi]MXQ09756.1 phytoene desaturase [Kangsaoukella pontilimi]
MKSPAGNRAVVIGAGLGGLAAAMRLGAKGWSVTVIDRLDSPGGRGSALTRDGYRFDLGPTIVTVPQVFRDLFRAVGRDFDSEVDLRALDPFYEIRWPDGSHFTARGSTEAMVEEVRRLSPGDVKGYLAFLRDAERRYVVGFEGMVAKPMHRFRETAKVLPEFAVLRADRSILGLARKRVRDERLRMALSFHPLFIGGDPRHVTSMYALVSHLEKEFGVHYAIGGVAAIASAMARAVVGQGGRLRYEATVSRIRTENGRATGVELDTGEVIDADLVVSNADAGHTYQNLLSDRAKRRWSPAKLSRTKWSMGLFVWYFGTSGTRAKWQDVGHHTILSGPRYEGLLDDIFTRGRLAEDMSLYVHRPSVTDPTVAPSGDDAFYVLSPVPHLGHADPVDWSRQAESYRASVLATLEERLLPGLSSHLTVSEVFTPETFRDRYLSPHGCGFSIEPRILQSAWFRPHNVSEELDGLYLVGAGTHPGAGLPGVVSSAEVLEKLVPDMRGHETPRMAAE